MKEEVIAERIVCKVPYHDRKTETDEQKKELQMAAPFFYGFHMKGLE